MRQYDEVLNERGFIVPGLGRAVQVEPMEPELKSPGSKRLKLKCDIELPLTLKLSNSTCAATLGRLYNYQTLLLLVGSRTPDFCSGHGGSLAGLVEKSELVTAANSIPAYTCRP